MRGAVDNLRKGDGLGRGPNRGKVAIRIDPAGRLYFTLGHRAEDCVPMSPHQFRERVMREKNPIRPDQGV